MLVKSKILWKNLLQKNLKNNNYEKINLAVVLISSFLVSCHNPLIEEKEAEIVISVNSTKNDDEWTVKDVKYLVRTQHITLATDSLYNVGDTLKIGKNENKIQH